MKKGLLIFLIIVFVFLVLPYAYLAFSGGNYDSPDEIESGEALPSALRYSFNPDKQTAGVKFVKSDLYCLAKSQYGCNAADYINSQISDYGFSLLRLGVHFSDGRILADLKLMYKGFLPLPLHIEAEPLCSASRVSFSISSLTVGKLIRINPSLVSPFTESFELDFPEMHPMFRKISGYSHDSDSFTVIIPYPADWLMAGVYYYLPSDISMTFDFVDVSESDTILPAVVRYKEGDPSELYAFLDSCRDDPARFAEIKADILGLGQPYAAPKFFSGDGSDYNPILFPEITTEYVESRYNSIRGSYQALYYERTGILSDAFQFVLDGFAEGSIVIGSRSMVYKDSGGSPVDFYSIPPLEGAGNWLDGESFRVILAVNCGNTTLSQVPTGNKVTAFIFRTETGRPVVAYRFSSALFKIIGIPEEEYSSLMNSLRVPVCDLGERTTIR